MADLLKEFFAGHLAYMSFSPSSSNLLFSSGLSYTHLRTVDAYVLQAFDTSPAPRYAHSLRSLVDTGCPEFTGSQCWWRDFSPLLQENDLLSEICAGEDIGVYAFGDSDPAHYISYRLRTSTLKM